jgi:DNA-binding CsgD family transcriptional regulator
MRMYSHPPDEQDLRHFLENIYFEDEINDFNWMIRARRPVALLSEATGGRLERSLRYRAAIAPRGLQFDLRAVFASGQAHWGGVSLFRARGQCDFNEREVALIGRLTPHLAAGLKAATLRAPLESTHDTPGVLVLDRRGRVVQYTASAERWLRELGDLGPGWQESQGLPGVVWLAVGALRHALNPATDRDLARVPRLTTQTRTGRWLHLQPALTEGPADREGDIVIVISPVGPPDLAWLRTTAYGLSAREREVAELVVRGASTRQIAATLFITEYTVQDHLAHIFDKVGVRSRRELIKRLYFESVFPAQ